MARPSKYDPKIMPVMAAQKRREGATKEQVAAYFNVDYSTLKRWEDNYPELHEALREAEEFVNATVENAMLKRARGYTYSEVTIEREPGKSTRRKRVIKQVIPDVDAAKYWLGNRWRDRWKSPDKADLDALLGADGEAKLFLIDGGEDKTDGDASGESPKEPANGVEGDSPGEV